MSEDLYAHIESEKKPDETLGEALERLVGGHSLTEFADDAAEFDRDFSVEDATDRAVGAVAPESRTK
ncbi:hypothetical protein GCM10008995_09560 [Halobellus salinus]|uniref:Uncharacterized protein n=1 Tax=Halobellus salinus TaxID=931585 RepID=A0A830E8X8_9EURY|nr:hypothetical protein [Halobellus salinus]GGJ01872.1 hypothetical protein GCM10008995_09560 [Halobellus salinus]SMP18126.1 hypothetical protein SAMN06265347_106124 [Halobellus salinus]